MNLAIRSYLFSFFLILTITNCGKVEVKGIPEKIQLEHSVSLKQLEEYYTAVCKNEIPDATATELKTCSENKVGDLLMFIQTGKAPTK